MFTSLNAEWKMFSSKDGTFIYEDQVGIFMKLKTDKKGREHFSIVPLKASLFHSSGKELLRNTKPSSQRTPKDNEEKNK